MKTHTSKCPHLHAIIKREGIKKATLKCSHDFDKFMRPLFIEMEVRESIYAVFLSANNTTIGWFEIGIGGINFVLADTRLMWNAAHQCGAVGLIVAHNHPSGNLRPSDADKLLAEKISQQCKIMEVNFLDNMILSESGYYSFADEQIL